MDQLTTHKKLTMQYVNEQPKIIDSTILRRMKVSKNALHMTGSRRNRAFSVAKRACGFGRKKAYSDSVRHQNGNGRSPTGRGVGDSAPACRPFASRPFNAVLDPKTMAGERYRRRRRSKACRGSRDANIRISRDMLLSPAVNIDKTTARPAVRGDNRRTQLLITPSPTGPAARRVASRHGGVSSGPCSRVVAAAVDDGSCRPMSAAAVRRTKQHPSPGGS